MGSENGWYVTGGWSGSNLNSNSRVESHFEKCWYLSLLGILFRYGSATSQEWRKNQSYRLEGEGGMPIQFLFSISNFSVLLLRKFTYSWVSSSALGCSFRHVKFDFQACGLCCCHWFHDSAVLSIQTSVFLTTSYTFWRIV